MKRGTSDLICAGEEAAEGSRYELAFFEHGVSNLFCDRSKRLRTEDESEGRLAEHILVRLN